MPTGDDEETQARSRLILAMEKLGVLSRIDEQGRVLAFDGKQEYQVDIDLGRLFTKGTAPYSRQIVVGKSSLKHLEDGDVTAMFPYGLVSPAKDRTGRAAQATPLSPHYRPLQWVPDEYNPDDDGLIADGDDWTYHIDPVREATAEVIGYRVFGGDNESGTTKFGSSLIGGMPGELTLEKAKAVAQQDYLSRYLEAEQFLDSLLGDWLDDDGPRTWRNDKDRIVCRVDLPGIDDVEVVATLEDYGDGYDANNQRVAVCIRTILSYMNDRDALSDILGELILPKSDVPIGINTDGTGMDIVYRVGVGPSGCDSVVFAERDRAEYVAHIRKALQDSSTWGELRRNLPDGEWDAHFQEYFDEYDKDVPGDDDPFASHDAPGRGDGDYPEWLAQIQLDWFPLELIKKYGGEVAASVLNGEVPDLPAARAEEIADDLRALGHTVERTDLEFE